MSKFEQAQEQHRETCRRGATVRARVRRIDAIEAYGSRCRVCGEGNWAGFQIVPLAGPRWRELVPDPPAQGARNKLAWLAKHGYPDTFTLVCGPSCRSALYAR
jgi:hypothetical protein